MKRSMMAAIAAVAMLVALSGSAKATQITIDAFTVGGMGNDPRPGSPFESRELFISGDPSVVTANVNTSNNTLELARTHTSAPGSFFVEWANWGPEGDGGPGVNWTGLQSVSFTINSTTGGVLDLKLGSISDGSTASRKLGWDNFTVPVGTTNVVLNVGSAYGSGTFEQQTLFDETNINWVILRVDSGTFNGVVSNFQSTVPEPATMSLLALGGIATLIRRRRRA